MKGYLSLQIISMNRSSKILLTIFFLSIFISSAISYYRLMILKDYAVFFDTETIPSSADFITYMMDRL